MARIVIVKPSFPLPPNQGTRRVSLALLRDLAGAHEVVYLCQRERREEADLIPELERCGARVIAPLMPNKASPFHRGLYRLWYGARSRLAATPPICFYWSNHVLGAALARLSREFRPDLTILESWETFRLRREIGRGRAALLAHDAAFQIRERALAAAEDAGERARLARRLRREKALEARSWRLCDAILTLTEQDRATIERELALSLGAGTTMTEARGNSITRAAVTGPGSAASARPPLPLVRHLPMPMPEEFFSFTRPAAAGARIGFLGTFRADFNRDALGHLLEDLWPAIRARVPGAELIIAGDGYEGPLRARALAQGAQWLGFIEDLGDYFGAIDALLVPLRFGAGLRIRILEALAAGVPVVASPVAVAGLGIADGEHFRMAEGPAATAEQLAALLADPAAATALGRRGRAWCAEQHGPAGLRPRRLDVIRQILELPVAAREDAAACRSG